MSIRTRIAPSPTGSELHIGNLYTAILNFAWAEKHNGNFIVRIEDTDRTRLVEGSENKILESLKTFGIKYSEGPDIDGPYGPYRQSDRLDIYHKYAQELIDKGHAYFSYYQKASAGQKKDYSKGRESAEDSLNENLQENAPKTIKEMIDLEDWVVKLRVPKNKKIKFKDIVRGEIEFDTSEVTEQVLIKSDGFPTYHLAVVVDDYLMKITHVIRAEDWISSTPKHVLLYQAFGWELPEYAHVPLLRNVDKSKLSKRKNPVWVSWYIQQGFLPEAVINYLCLMGWSHPKQIEIFSFDEFIKVFDLIDLKTVGPVFDIKKLTWMNQQYIQNLENSDLKKRLISYYKDNLKVKNESLDELVSLSKTRMEVLSDFEKLTAHFIDFKKPDLNDTQSDLRNNLFERLSKLEKWEKDEIFEIMKIIMQDKKVKMKEFYYILTGSSSGLPLPESIEILGKQETLKRLK